MTDDLKTRVSGLSREEAIEAARFVCSELADERQVQLVEEELSTIATEPYRQLPHVETMARLVLVGAAADAASVPLVERALAGVGRKQVVLGGTEIIALAALSVVALKIIVSRGRGKVTVRQTVKDAQGNVVLEQEIVEEPVSISEELAAVLSKYFGGSNPD